MSVLSVEISKTKERRTMIAKRMVSPLRCGGKDHSRPRYVLRCCGDCRTARRSAPNSTWQELCIKEMCFAPK
jgi:hypothetical protein